MTRVFAAALATLALSAAAVSPASAFTVSWDVDHTQSSFTLTVPDQPVTLGDISGTLRLRNQNNAAWTTNTAPVDGILATDITPGFSSIQFLGGASSLVGLNTGSYRPNPAAFSTAATSTINTAGSFTNTSSAPAVYAARVNAFVGIVNLNLGYISFDNVSYDASSAAIAFAGTSFLANGITVGLADSRVNFDAINTIVGQPVGDAQSQSGPLSGINSGAGSGSMVNVGGTLYRLTVPINLPVTVTLSGLNLNATATGTLVAFANIPEPATLVTVMLGLAGLAGFAGRRKH
jgi:hypothetical protein